MSERMKECYKPMLYMSHKAGSEWARFTPADNEEATTRSSETDMYMLCPSGTRHQAPGR